MNDIPITPGNQQEVNVTEMLATGCLCRANKLNKSTIGILNQYKFPVVIE